MTDDHTSTGSGSPPAGGTAPRPGGPGTAEPHGFFNAIRRTGLVRGQDRWVGGVCSGLAERFGLDPLLVRGLVAVTGLLGIGLVLYGLAWAVLPEPDGRIHLEQALHGDWNSALVGAGVLVAIGAGNGGWWFSWEPFRSGWFSTLAWSGVIIAAVIIAGYAYGHRRSSAASPEHPGPGTASSGPVFSVATPPPAPSPAPGPPKTPGPHRPQAPGPGSVLMASVTGLILLILAVLLIAHRQGAYTGPLASMAVGIGVVLVGLAIVLCGVLGRRAGGLTALAIVGFIAAGPALITDTADLSWIPDGIAASVGDVDYTPQSRAAAAEGFVLAVGSARIDLRDVPVSAGQTLAVPIDAGLGDVTIVVPAGTPITASVQCDGSMVWNVDGTVQTLDNLGDSHSFATDEVTEGATAQLDLQVHAGLGDVTIEEQ